MKRIYGAASLSGLTVIGAGVFLVDRPRPAIGPTAEVHTAAFTATLVERGAVGSARLMLYGSSIPGVQVKIAELVREGTTVANGDVLIRFDATPFQQGLAREDASLAQARADLVRAQEERHLDDLRADDDIGQAKQQVGYAQTAVDDETSGKGRVAVAEATAAEADAGRELTRARAAYADMKPMLDRGFITRAELERAEQAVTRADEQVRLAAIRREALVGFERPAAAARSQGSLESARQALTRQSEAARARRVEHDAAVRIASGRVDELTARVELLRQQIDRCLVRAGTSGMVVYRELFFGTDKRKPQIGDEVWSNQPLIALPDFDHLTVETRIRESDLHHVRIGGAAAVTVPAYPGLTLTGTVALIGALAESDTARAGTKFFPVTIAIETRDPRLRTGMTAEVGITVATLPAATVVPIQAIADVAGHPSVFVLQRGHPVARPIVVAASNDREAAIASGVAPGEVVALYDPRAAPRQDER
jgi:HlyD family secretion protein